MKPEWYKEGLEVALGHLQAGPGALGVPALGAPTQHWPLPTLVPLMGSDKVAAHTDECPEEGANTTPSSARHFFMSPLTQELSSLQLLPQNRAAGPFHPTSASSSLECFVEMQLGQRIVCVGTSMLHQLHGYLQGQWCFSLAKLHRLLKQRGVALFGIDSASITFTAWI